MATNSLMKRARPKDWLHTTDPETGKPATRETNTMPQWAGSCWYYLRFVSPNRDDVAWDLDEEKYWMPVDLYVGGSEHAVLHLLYARFWHKVLYDAGYVSTKEPFHERRGRRLDPLPDSRSTPRRCPDRPGSLEFFAAPPSS